MQANSKKASNNSSPLKGSNMSQFWKNFINNPKSMSSDSVATNTKQTGSSNGLSPIKRPPLSRKPFSFQNDKEQTQVPGKLSTADYKNYRDMFLSNRHDFTGRIFGVSLSESLSVASAEVIVQSELVSFGRIPIIVAKCGAYLKAHALKTSGIFRIAGNNKRVKELQYIFSTPPDYGTKFNDWESYSVHDVASLLRRFLNNLKEPLISLDLYEDFRNPLRERPRILKHMLSHSVSHPNANKENSLSSNPELQLRQEDKGNDGDNEKELNDNENDEELKKRRLRHKKRLSRDIRSCIKEYETLFLKLSNDSKQLTIYLLDLLSLFARQSQFNLMSGRNLAAIFQPSVLSHPQHDMDPKEYELSRFVVEFLIEYSYKLLPHLLKLAKDEQKQLKNTEREPLKTPVTTPTDSAPKAIDIPNKNKLTPSKYSTPMSPSNSLLKGVSHGKSQISTTGLKAPNRSRPHSKSIGSVPTPPDVITSNKRRISLFPWLHKPDILSDTGDLTATENEGDDIYDDENVNEVSRQSPISIPSMSGSLPKSQSNYLNVPKIYRSTSGGGTPPSVNNTTNQRPMSMVLNNHSMDEIDNALSSDNNEEGRTARSKKRESWFQRLTSRSRSGSISRS
ncbi:hypothetical protein KAFR_0E03630 [Kazachstania africana CBS 2517]|uniref:Rho-GAP domain-containing protein n=1 Tax=Kazachstania africana (strain ATCC 22294 / BCRC 22015 / CBS 2517 / CECT 1963 / NBRC 1671 / NRRL Y-8276) TaxID=1071382 RepID=H2AVW4_KAZAF|nr:hypothetical protein KAFR_0E03630 [Kazachstania africana CBS 2517]CCF58514.1 hypothetical protein KAFR_0E03630 [Kazachstania africana CBS 2517]